MTARDIRGDLILARLNMVLWFEMNRPDDWPAMVETAVVGLGGSLTLPADPAHPRRADSWSSHMAELSLLGITGRGDNLDSAVRDWIKAASRTVETEEAA